ncbi:MAG: phage holin family protein [Bacteroidales bacterium]|nr:phage holin family protein [Bacteroidales bacterium]
MDHIKKYLILPSAFLGLVGSIAREYLLLIILVAVAIVLDVISGLIRAVATGEAISSEKGTRGFWKKMILLFSMGFAFFLDVATPTILEVVKINPPFDRSLIFGCIVCVYIVLNESISIFENILKTNNKALPKWIKKLLQGAKEELEKKGETVSGKDK